MDVTIFDGSAAATMTELNEVIEETGVTSDDPEENNSGSEGESEDEEDEVEEQEEDDGDDNEDYEDYNEDYRGYSEFNQIAYFVLDDEAQKAMELVKTSNCKYTTLAYPSNMKSYFYRFC